MNPNHRNPVQRLSCNRLFHSTLILLVIILLSGCALLPEAMQPPKPRIFKTDHDPATEARIRVYVSHRLVHTYVSTFLFPERSCYTQHNPGNMIQAHIEGVSTGALFFPPFQKNREIGIPKNPNMPPEYNEFVITANQPLTIVSMLNDSLNAIPGNRLTFRGGQWRCGPIAMTFIPQPGHDYETSLQISKGASGNHYCFIQLQRLIQTPEGLKIEDARHEEAERCPVIVPIRR